MSRGWFLSLTFSLVFNYYTVQRKPISLHYNEGYILWSFDPYISVFLILSSLFLCTYHLSVCLCPQNLFYLSFCLFLITVITKLSFLLSFCFCDILAFVVDKCIFVVFKKNIEFCSRLLRTVAAVFNCGT